MDWYLRVLRNYAEFSGRACRREYWTFACCNFLASLVFPLLDLITGLAKATNGVGFFSVLFGLYSLAVIVPGFAVSVRRLQDTGRSGWFVLLGLIPCVGTIVLIVFMLGDSQPGDNEYGPNPKGVMV